jgi:Ni/Co efflux regulator RcnB
MHVTFRPSLLAGVLTIVAAPFALAQSGLPDPVAPAVIGRPLDQIKPVRPHVKPAVAKPAAAKPVRPSQVATARPAMQAPPPRAQAVMGAPAAAAVVQQAPAVQPVRAITRPLVPGNYFSSQDQDLVRSYYKAHPVSAQPARWTIGAPIPPKSALTGVPDDVRAALTPLPPGHQYVEVDGDVVLVAVQTRVVVDGISRSMR